MRGYLLESRLLADRVDDYDLAHTHVPDEVVDAIRSAGISDWTIWRSGISLYQLVVCDAPEALQRAMLTQPESWNARMREMVDVTHPSIETIPVEIPWCMRSK